MISSGFWHLASLRRASLRYTPTGCLLISSCLLISPRFVAIVYPKGTTGSHSHPTLRFSRVSVLQGVSSAYYLRSKTLLGPKECLSFQEFLRCDCYSRSSRRYIKIRRYQISNLDGWTPESVAANRIWTQIELAESSRFCCLWPTTRASISLTLSTVRVSLPTIARWALTHLNKH